MNILEFKNEVKEACEHNLPLFSLYFFGAGNPNPDQRHISTGKVPWFHRLIYKMAHDRSIKFKAITVAREHAKSTTVCFVGVMHDIVYGHEKYIKMFTKTRGLAGEHLDAIKSALEYNDVLREFYGVHLSDYVRKQQYEIITGNNIKITAQGLDAPARGTKFGRHRISKLIIDDVQAYKDCLNPDRREDVRITIGADVNYALDKANGHAISIGTIVHHDCYIATCMNDSRFQKVFLPAVLNDGNADPEKYGERRALWGDYITLEELDIEREEMRKNGVEAVFLQERMNIPISAKLRLTNEIREWKGTFRRAPGTTTDHLIIIDNETIPVKTFSIVDYAASKSQTSCWNVVLTIAIDANSNIYLLKCWNEKTDNPLETAIQWYWQAYRFGASKMFAERAGTLDMMRKTLEIIQKDKPTFRSLLLQKDSDGEYKQNTVPINMVDTFVGYSFPSITPVTHRLHESGKDGRILDTLMPYYRSAKIFHRPEMEEYRKEALTFPQSRYKDVMDALEVGVLNGIRFKPRKEIIEKQQIYNPLIDTPTPLLTNISDLRQYSAWAQ